MVEQVAQAGFCVFQKTVLIKEVFKLMKCIHIIIGFVTLCLVVVLFTASCEKSKDNSTDNSSIKPSPAAEIKKVEEIPFALSLSNLSPNYQGSDIETVYKSINQTVAKEGQSKGEFETTEEYNKRIRSLKAKTFGIFAFKRNVNSKYNADEEVFNISLNINTLEGIVINDTSYVKEYLEIKEMSIVDGKYVGQNAFGATTDVTTVKNHIYGLTIGTFDYNKTLGREKREFFSFNIKIPRDKAVAIKKDIMALIIFEPQSTSFDSIYSIPTFNKPIRRIDYYRGLDGKLIAIWIYNKQTGEILLKKDIESSK
jgi:uncharacterized membrane protein